MEKYLIVFIYDFYVYFWVYDELPSKCDSLYQGNKGMYRIPKYISTNSNHTMFGY